MRAGNAKGTGVPRSARRAGTGPRSDDRGRELNEFDGHCPQSILGVDEGMTGASENDKLGDVDAMNARRQLATASQRTNLRMGHGPPLASSDGLGHLSDPGDQPGEKPASQPVVGSHGVCARGVQRHSGRGRVDRGIDVHRTLSRGVGPGRASGEVTASRHAACGV
jgi:hypothetical protein